MEPLHKSYRNIKSNSPENDSESHPGHSHNSPPVHTCLAIHHSDQERRRKISHQVHGKYRYRHSLWSEFFVDTRHESNICRSKSSKYLLQEKQKLRSSQTNKKEHKRSLICRPPNGRSDHRPDHGHTASHGSDHHNQLAGLLGPMKIILLL